MQNWKNGAKTGCFSVISLAMYKTLSLPLALLLAGCSQQVQLTFYTDTCQDWDLTNEAPELIIEAAGEDISLVRMGVEQPFGAKFSPVIQANGWRIQIFEDWVLETEEEEGDELLCLAPTVVMKSPPTGDYEIQWFPQPNVITPVHEEVVVVEG